jgi:hypothetical protein
MTAVFISGSLTSAEMSPANTFYCSLCRLHAGLDMARKENFVWELNPRRPAHVLAIPTVVKQTEGSSAHTKCNLFSLQM